MRPREIPAAAPGAADDGRRGRSLAGHRLLHLALGPARNRRVAAPSAGDGQAHAEGRCGPGRRHRRASAAADALRPSRPGAGADGRRRLFPASAAATDRRPRHAGAQPPDADRQRRHAERNRAADPAPQRAVRRNRSRAGKRTPLHRRRIPRTAHAAGRAQGPGPGRARGHRRRPAPTCAGTDHPRLRPRHPPRDPVADTGPPRCRRRHSHAGTLPAPDCRGCPGRRRRRRHCKSLRPRPGRGRCPRQG